MYARMQHPLLQLCGAAIPSLLSAGDLLISRGPFTNEPGMHLPSILYSISFDT